MKWIKKLYSYICNVVKKDKKESSLVNNETEKIVEESISLEEAYRIWRKKHGH